MGCNNERKIGKAIFDFQMHHFSSIKRLNKPQIIVVIAEPSSKLEIERHFIEWDKKISSGFLVLYLNRFEIESI